MLYQKAIRVLMAMPSLENHTRGLLSVASMLREAGMEVILLGNERADRIVDIAIRENADVIGVSTYCGSSVVFGKDLMEAAERKCLKNVSFLIGGIFPPQDEPELKKMGFAGVFPSGPGASRDKILSCIEVAVKGYSSY